MSSPTSSISVVTSPMPGTLNGAPSLEPSIVSSIIRAPIEQVVPELFVI